jgi:hypothetical protein
VALSVLTGLKQNAVGFIGAVDHIMSFQMVCYTTLMTQCFLCSSLLLLHSSIGLLQLAANHGVK